MPSQARYVLSRLRKNERERVRFRRLKALMKDLGDSLPKTAPRSRLTEANVLSQAKQHMLDLTAEVARLSAENLQLKEWLDKTNNRLSEMMETERKRNESPRGDIQPTNAFIAPWESETLPDIASSPQCDRTSMSSNHISPTVPEEKYSHYLVPSPSLAERTPFYHVPAAEQDQSSPVFLSENNFSDTDSDIKRAAACLVLLSKQAHKLQDEPGKTDREQAGNPSPCLAIWWCSNLPPLSCCAILCSNFQFFLSPSFSLKKKTLTTIVNQNMLRFARPSPFSSIDRDWVRVPLCCSSC